MDMGALIYTPELCLQKGFLELQKGKCQKLKPGTELYGILRKKVSPPIARNSSSLGQSSGITARRELVEIG